MSKGRDLAAIISSSTRTKQQPTTTLLSSTKSSKKFGLQAIRSASVASLINSKNKDEEEHQLCLHFPEWSPSTLSFDTSTLNMPRRYLYSDYAMSKPSHQLDWKGWMVCVEAFSLISSSKQFANLVTLSLDHAIGLGITHFRHIRGNHILKRLTLVGIDVEIDHEMGEILASIRSLVFLSLAECTIHEGVMNTLSTSLSSLKTLVLTKSHGIDDYQLVALGRMIERFRTLQNIDISRCLDFKDEGLLDLVQAGFTIIHDLNISHCRQLSTIAIASLRSKMSSLEILHINNLLVGPSAYEYISEGCKMIKHLYLQKSPELADDSLIKIGRWCRFLQTLNISNCPKISDTGIVGFFEKFSGNLQALDLNACGQCGDASIIAITSKCSTLLSLKINGLSKVTVNILKQFFMQAVKLEYFEMCSELRTTASHRRSMMPHLSDAVFRAMQSNTFSELHIVGACQVTDAGIVPLTERSSWLKVLDLSYCSNIADNALFAIAQHSPHLQTLIMTGCVFVSNEGMRVLSQGVCHLTLRHLEINGCNRVNDDGLTYIASMSNLEMLGFRSCDLITDIGIVFLTQHCRKLKTLDMMNLDLVTLDAMKEIAKSCRYITNIHCGGCEFNGKDLAKTVKYAWPFAQPDGLQCSLQPRHRSIIQYNTFILEQQQAEKATRVIQKFGKFIRATLWLRIARKLRLQKRQHLKRIFDNFLMIIRRERKENRQLNKLEAVKVLQKLIPRLYAMKTARRKLLRLKRERDARSLLQRVYRGHKCRRRWAARFRRLYYYYSQIGFLVHKYRVLLDARKLHKQILSVQAFVRMVATRLSFLRHRFAFVAFQRQIRKVMRFIRNVKQRKLIADQLKADTLKRRNAAVRVIQKNWKNRLFNGQMAPFILTCCIVYRNDYDERMWSALLIQQRYRGFIIRWRKWKASEYYRLGSVAVLVLQRQYRRYIAHKHYLPYRDYYRYLYPKMRRLLVKSRPKLRLGKYCKRIQRCFHIYKFMCARHTAATQMQRRWRGIGGRMQWIQVLQEMRDMLANRIKNAFHVFKCRRMRREMAARQHMAAYRIYLMINKPFEIKRAMAAKIEEQRAYRQQLQVLKREQLQARYQLTVNKIRNDYRNKQATKIQRCWFAYLEYQKVQDEISMLEKGNSLSGWMNRSQDSIGNGSVTATKSETGVVATGRRVAFAVKETLRKPIDTVANVANAVKDFIQPEELIPKRDEKRLANAVLKYQIQSVLQEGIIDIHLTCGEIETNTYEANQATLRNASLPYFIKVQEDLSGMLLNVYLWVKYGKGADCICQMEVVPKPKNISNAGMKSREEVYKEQHVILAWHPHIHFEIRAVRSIRQGRPEFAIQEVKVITSQKEFDAFSLQTKYRCLRDLAELGFDGMSLWCTGRQLEDEESMYKYNHITALPWCDERMLRTVKSFLVSEADVFEIKRCFTRIIGGRNRDTVKVAEIFATLKLEMTEVCEWAVLAIEPARRKEITFSEYLHFVSYFVMLDGIDLGRFLFYHADTEDQGYLLREQFQVVIRILAKGSPFNGRAWAIQYEQYYDQKLKYMFVPQFLEFIAANPGALWQPQLLQQRLKKANMGLNYWDKKMEQYRVIRENLGIKLM